MWLLIRITPVFAPQRCDYLMTSPWISPLARPIVQPDGSTVNAVEIPAEGHLLRKHESTMTFCSICDAAWRSLDRMQL